MSFHELVASMQDLSVEELDERLAEIDAERALLSTLRKSLVARDRERRKKNKAPVRKERPEPARNGVPAAPRARKTERKPAEPKPAAEAPVPRKTENGQFELLKSAATMPLRSIDVEESVGHSPEGDVVFSYRGKDLGGFREVQGEAQVRVPAAESRGSRESIIAQIEQARQQGLAELSRQNGGSPLS